MMKQLKEKLLLTLFLLFSSSIISQGQTTTAWNEFDLKSDNNVLLDFSYAGYNHGLSLPPEDFSGYKVYNITDFGAQANDDVSDCAAFEALVKQIEKDRGLRSPNANAIIYFPEGEFILHGPEDDKVDASGKKISTTLNVVLGHVILRGAGRDKTTIKMTAPMQPTNPAQLYSSPVMLSFRNNGVKFTDLKIYGKVTNYVKKNDMAVEVSSTNGLKAGDWVLLYMKNTDYRDRKDLTAIQKELNGLSPASSMKNLLDEIVVNDYHQIKEIVGNKIIFEEPIMHEIDPSYDWSVYEYRHYEGVGIEDLTFEGDATEYFCHHKSWEDDGGYKPLNLVRLTNSWIRRVNFKSITECATFQDCANSVCYDVEISGNRGHSAVRMANSSRGFIANVYDHSDGYLDSDAKVDKFINRRVGLGQYHACGVSKHSIGNVIWNCEWGSDACFESHATQPRATLFDNCKGGFMQLRMGGALDQLPNHLDDLTIWNFDCTITNTSEFPFQWWDSNPKRWYKTMPPTVVGFHGVNVEFQENQMKRNESQGDIVTPYSLYEAQLKRRLGYVPSWLMDLKGHSQTVPERPGRTWDFTSLSIEDEEALNADTKWISKTENLRNYYNNNYSIGKNSNKDVEIMEIGNYAEMLIANGKDLECSKKLKFCFYVSNQCKPLPANKLMICTDNGNRSLRLNADGIAIVIPDCKKGQQVVVHSKSVTSTDKRYLKANNLDIIEGFEEPDNAAEVQESRGVVHDDGDVVLVTYRGNFLYDITLKDAKGNMITSGITHITSPANTISTNYSIYNLAGQRVNSSYRGIIIRNGKKYLQK